MGASSVQFLLSSEEVLIEVRNRRSVSTNGARNWRLLPLYNVDIIPAMHRHRHRHRPGAADWVPFVHQDVLSRLQHPEYHFT